MAVVTESLNDPFKFKINGGEYYCRFLITDNVDPDKARHVNSIELTKSAIVSLDIHETIFEPYIKGSITLNNPFDYIENHHFSTGQGDDFLHIELIDYKIYKEGNEKLTGGSTLHGNAGSLQKQGVRYASEKLKYSFVITSEDNSISKSDRSNNFKTYQLIDINWFLLNKRVVQGIAYPPDKHPPMPMGDMIKDLLVKTLGSNVIDESNWTPGDHIVGNNLGEKLISFEDAVRPGQHWRYSDLIKYLLRYNYSLAGAPNDDNSQGIEEKYLLDRPWTIEGWGNGGGELPVHTILQYNRHTNQYSLIPLDMYFKNNKELVIEGFGVGDLTPADARSSHDGVKGNPVSPLSGPGAVPINKYTGMVNNTDLTTPFTMYSNEFFVNYNIDSPDILKGCLDKSVIKVEEIADAWDREFIKNFELVGGAPVPFLQFKHEEGRLCRPLSMPKFDRKDCLNIGKAQMVYNFTFYNLELNLDNVGDTSRRPGRFIDIFKPSTETEAGADAKLLGRWFVTSVHHRFIKDQYQTLLQCVKLYTAAGLDDRKIDMSLDPGIIEGQHNPPWIHPVERARRAEELGVGGGPILPG